jgi:hypothetical protein
VSKSFRLQSRVVYWNDEQALEQALLVAKNHKINLPNIKKWAKSEGHLLKLGQFLEQLNQKSSKECP